MESRLVDLRALYLEKEMGHCSVLTMESHWESSKVLCWAYWLEHWSGLYSAPLKVVCWGNRKESHLGWKRV
jgi:hypothetical protein